MTTEQEIKDAEAKAAAEKLETEANEGADNAIKEAEDLVGKGGDLGEDGFVKVKKSQIHKVMSDRNNYKKMGLDKKIEDRKLDVKVVDDKVVVDKAVIDEKKIQETAADATKKTLREAAEKTAKRLFFKDHPEYVDEAEWNKLLPNLTFKGDETTTEEVSDRMEAAVLEHKRKTGKLEEYMEAEKNKAHNEGHTAGQMEIGREMGGAGDKNEAGNSKPLTEKGKEMTNAMHNDPEKVSKVDIKKDSEITTI